MYYTRDDDTYADYWVINVIYLGESARSTFIFQITKKSFHVVKETVKNLFIRHTYTGKLKIRIILTSVNAIIPISQHKTFLFQFRIQTHNNRANVLS